MENDAPSIIARWLDKILGWISSKSRKEREAAKGDRIAVDKNIEELSK